MNVVGKLKEVNDKDPAGATKSREQKLGRPEGKLTGNLMKWVILSTLPFSAHVQARSPHQVHSSGIHGKD